MFKRSLEYLVFKDLLYFCLASKIFQSFLGCSLHSLTSKPCTKCFLDLHFAEGLFASFDKRNCSCFSFGLLSVFHLCLIQMEHYQPYLWCNSSWSNRIHPPSISNQNYSPESVKTLATAGTSISESCGWLYTFINDIYFRMNDGELIRTIKEILSKSLSQ